MGDEYTTTPTHVRIWSERTLGFPRIWWFIDGADDEGNFTESYWTYDSYKEAVDNLPNFVRQQVLYAGVTWLFRAGRRGRIHTSISTPNTQEVTA